MVLSDLPKGLRMLHPKSLMNQIIQMIWFFTKQHDFIFGLTSMILDSTNHIDVIFEYICKYQLESCNERREHRGCYEHHPFTFILPPTDQRS